MSKFARYAGFVWAAPLTVPALVYVMLFSLMGWYGPAGQHGDAWVWRLNESELPKWLERLWARWGGHAIGNVVVMKTDIFSSRGAITLRHEQEHVRQCMVLGVFQPVFYFLASVGLRFCRNAHHYYDNPFEIDARRAAGQVIDVIGAVRRAAIDGRIKMSTTKSSLE